MLGNGEPCMRRQAIAGCRLPRSVGAHANMCYALKMVGPRSKPSDEIDFAPPSADVSAAEYAAWKIEKVTKALKQCEDRDAMIPAADVWERFGFER
jgi:hypothetical protein